MHSAKKCIDLCVYSITCSELADVVVKLNNLGVQVRVITDTDQLDATGSQAGRFRMEGQFTVVKWKTIVGFVHSFFGFYLPVNCNFSTFCVMVYCLTTVYL